MEFTIKEEYIKDVHIEKSYSLYSENEQTEEHTLAVLKGQNTMVWHSTEDHPEFTKLRDTLEQQGFISTQRNCWNGDKVLKPFKLNDIKFKTGDRFLCAAALNVAIRVAKKYGEVYKPSI